MTDELERAARAMLDEDLEWRIGQIQGFQYGTEEKPIYVIRDCLKPYGEQELYRSETDYGDLLYQIKMQRRLVAGLKALLPVSDETTKAMIVATGIGMNCTFPDAFTAAILDITKGADDAGE
jgi:hypothetical protein